MKRLAIAVSMLAIGAAGCGSSTTPTSPSTFKIFTVQFPGERNAADHQRREQSGRGTAVITIHTDTNTMDFSFSLNGFPANTNVILAHIHPGAAGVNGRRADRRTASRRPRRCSLTDGSGTFTANGVTAAATTQRRRPTSRPSWPRRRTSTSTCTRRQPRRRDARTAAVAVGSRQLAVGSHELASWQFSSRASWQPTADSELPTRLPSANCQPTADCNDRLR